MLPDTQQKKQCEMLQNEQKFDSLTLRALPLPFAG